MPFGQGMFGVDLNNAVSSTKKTSTHLNLSSLRALNKKLKNKKHLKINVANPVGQGLKFGLQTSTIRRMVKEVNAKGLFHNYCWDWTVSCLCKILQYSTILSFCFCCRFCKYLTLLGSCTLLIFTSNGASETCTECTQFLGLTVLTAWKEQNHLHSNHSHKCIMK